jgi:ornithine carbamoyltransferase
VSRLGEHASPAAEVGPGVRKERTTTVAGGLRGRSYLKELDFSGDELRQVMSLASELKAAKRQGRESRQLDGRNIVLLFEKPSTRTRSSFEVAAHDQGAHATYFGDTGSHLGHDESLADTAQLLGRLFDGIAYRGHGQDRVETLAAHARVPVWNGLTDQWHPTQTLADVLTMTEATGKSPEDISFCFLGDTRGNMARSLLVAGSLLGMDVRLCGPRSLWPPHDVVHAARERAAGSGARCTIEEDTAALAGVDVVYTDVWVSMGEPIETWDERLRALAPYRVTAETMRVTGNPDAKFLHCLPAVHDQHTEVGRRIYEQAGLDGVEVTDEVFRSEASLVFDQAENRLHTIKALLVATLAPAG